MKRYILPLLFAVFCAHASPVTPESGRVEAHHILLDAQLPELVRAKASTLKAAKKLADTYKGAAEIGVPELALWAEIAGERTGIPPRLILAVAGHESSFNTKAKSRRGAHGLMQIRPAIWSASVRELQDYRYSLMRGAEILALYREKCHGNLKCALHMYNVGESNYTRGMRNPAYVADVRDIVLAIGGHI